MTALVTTDSGLAVPVQREQTVPEYEQVAAAFLASYRNVKTRTNYAQALKVFFAWCRAQGLDPLKGVKRAHIELWMRQMEEGDGLAIRTIVGRMNAVAGYYKTAVMDDHIDASPATFVKRPRVERISSTNGVTGAELLRIVDIAEKRSVRDCAIFLLLGYNGLRVGELVGLRVEALEIQRGFPTITVHRKGDRTQTLPLAHRTAAVIHQLVGNRTQGPLFTSKRTPGKPMTANDVQQLVKRYAKWAGIRKRISPHSFRHGFVTIGLDAGVPPRDIQRAAGHSDPRMTAYYDRGRQSFANDATFGVSAYVEGMR